MKTFNSSALCIQTINACCNTQHPGKSISSAILVFALLLFSVNLFAQTTLVAYDFNSGNSFASSPSNAISGITGAVTGSGSYAEATGTGTGSNAFTANGTGGDAMFITDNNSLTFTLTGGSLPCYSTFKVYFMGRRDGFGDANNTFTLSYSLNGGSFTSTGITPGSTLSVTSSSTWAQPGTVFSIPVAANNPSTSLAFRVSVGNVSGSTENYRFDNFQVQGVAGTPPTCSISGNQTICPGGSSTFTASGGGTYSWSTGATTAAINVTTAGTYTVTVTGANGCTSSCTRALTVSSACPDDGDPCTTESCVSGVCTPSFCNDNNICTDDICIPGVGCQFFANSASCNDNNVCTINDICSNSTCQGGGPLDCDDNDLCTADGCVNPSGCTHTYIPASCSISGQDSVCAGNTTSFTASGGVSYHWSGPDGFEAFTDNTGPIGTEGTYTVTVTNANGCTSTCSQTLIIPTVTASIIGDNKICLQTFTSFTASGAGPNGSYQWSGPDAELSTNTANTGDINEAGVYSVTVTTYLGCTATASYTLTVDTLPVCSITGVESTCSNLPVPWTAHGGSSYLWSGPGGFSAAVSPTNVVIPGTYTVTVTDGNGCTSSCTKDLGTIPAPLTNLSGDQLLCPGDTTEFYVTTDVGTEFLWSGPDGFSSTNDTISNLTLPGYYKVTVTNGSNGCTDVDSILLFINSAPVCNISGGLNTICNGTTTSWAATGGMSFYTWTGPNGFNATTQNVTVGGDGELSEGDYTLIIENNNGCKDTCSRHLTVNPLPVVTVTGIDSICSGESTLFVATGGTGFAWSRVPAGFTSTNDSITITQGGVYTVTVTLTGCTATGSRTLYVRPNDCADHTVCTNDFCNGYTGCSYDSLPNCDICGYTTQEATAYTEDFAYADGTTTSTPAGKWTRTTPGGTFAVSAGQMQGSNTGGNAVWTSQSINISQLSNVTASLVLSSSTGTLETSDSIRVTYSLNGGSQTLFPTNGRFLGGISGTPTAAVTGLNGSTLVIVVTLKNSNADEIYRFDNVLVTGTDTTFTCNDGNACTDDNCNGSGQCIYTTHVCDDLNVCTDNFCDNGTGCYYLANVLSCDDNSACTNHDTCSATICAGTPISCDDNDACTTDGCVAATGCTHTAVNCDDSNACTTDGCNPSTGCTHDAVPDCVPCSYSSQSVTPYTEDFESYANGTTTSANWTLSSATGMSVQTSGTKMMQCVNPGAERSLTTSVINIAGLTNVSVSALLTEEGDCEVEDYLRAYYRLNGGPETLLTNGNQTDDFTSATATVTGLSGNTLQLVFRFLNSQTSEFHRLDNIVVTATQTITSPCNDDNACTSDVCNAPGICAFTPITCEDNNFCTDNSCNPSTGCVYTPNTLACNDNTACTENDICSNSVCAGTTVICDDSTACTTDACNPATGCVFTTVNCNDNNPCTTDSCNAITGCTHDVIPGCVQCSLTVTTPTLYSEDFTYANGTTTSSKWTRTPGNNGSFNVQSNVMEGVNLDAEATLTTTLLNITGYTNVTVSVALSESGTLESSDYIRAYYKLNGGAETLLTNGNQTDDFSSATASISGLSGTSIQLVFRLQNSEFDEFHRIDNIVITATQTTDPCNDNTVCTTDACNTGAGVCVFTPVNCADVNPCTIDACHAVSGCSNTPINCNDNNACTTDACNSSGVCVHFAVNCADASPCTIDACDTTTGCSNTPIVCEDNDACTINACNGSGVCVYPAIDCNDNNACTDDGCDISTGCTHTPTVCNDNSLCTTDACNAPTIGCQYTPITCNDNNSCTTDGCDAGTGCTFTSLPDNSTCSSDANACTNDICISTTCTHQAIDCNDFEPCTVDGCDPGSGCTYDVPFFTTTLNESICFGDSVFAKGEWRTEAGTYRDTVFGGSINGCDTITVTILSVTECTDDNTCTQDVCTDAGTAACTFPPIDCDDSNECTTDGCDDVCFHTVIYVTKNLNPYLCFGDSVFAGGDWQTEFGTYYDTVQGTVGCDTVVITNFQVRECTDDQTCTQDICNPNNNNPTCSFPPINCDDSNVCTQDLCSEDIDGCYHPYIYVQVTDSPRICFGDSVFAGGDWQTELGNYYDTIPGTVGCDTVLHTNLFVRECTDDNDCTDDFCADAVCSFVAIDCNDDNFCTDDACVDGICVYTPHNCSPVITTPASSQTGECSPLAGLGVIGWLSSNGGAQASDVCGPVQWTNNFTSLSDDCGLTGSATVTFTATDACGNTATTVATYSIEDNLPPTIDTPASDETVECDGTGNTSELQAWINAHGGASATDLCGAVTWTHSGSPDAGCGDTESATITFTATDECGNTATTVATFTIEDTTPPSIDTGASDETVECDGAGNTAALNAWLSSHGGAAASDICGSVTWSHDFTILSDDCGATGSATVTFTATDACGNTATTSATFTIEDTQDPVISQGASALTVECSINTGTEINAWLDSHGGASASDVCGGQFWSHNFTGFTGCSGNEVVTFTVSDGCGNTSTTTATLTLTDNTNPTIDTGASDETVECGPDNNSALDTWLSLNGGASASDNCGSVSWSHSSALLSDDCGNTGTVTVTFTATDACGNTATTSAKFTVEDTTPPSLGSLAANSTVECDGSGNSTELNAWLNTNGGATATDLCGDVTWTNDFTALSDDCGATGDVYVTFTATDDCGNTATTAATFTIEDTTPPSFVNSASNETVECDGAGNTGALNAWLAANGNATASDACSGVTWTNNYTGLSDDCGATGSTTVTFTAEDACGNTASTTATFTIEDTTPPSFGAAAADETVECDGAGNTSALNAWLAANGGASSSDACGNVTWSNDFTALSDGCGETGSATVTFTATDACGNTATTSATFTIEDTDAPEITTTASDLTVECDGFGNTTQFNAWRDSNAGAEAGSDECGTVTWSNAFNSETYTCGSTITKYYIFTATDACGNTATTTAFFATEDVTAPSIELPAEALTLECSSGYEGEITQWLDLHGGAFADDACSNVSWSHDYTGISDGCGLTGSATVIFTATDGCGNTATISALLTITDNTGPAIVCPGSTTVESGGSTLPTATGTATCTDCDPDAAPTYQDATEPGICANSFQILRTWTCTDACGNTSTCVQTISVSDNVPPAIVCPNDTTISCISSTDTSATGAADCGETLSYTDVIIDGECDSYTIKRTWTCKDVCDNATSCTQTINVQDNPPVAQCKPTLTVTLDNTGHASILPGDLNNGSSDDCGTVNLDINKSSFSCADVGSVTVTLSVDDGCFAHTVTCTTLVTVVSNCDDDNACTTDACDAVDGCTHAVVNCDDGNFCTTDACDTETGCYHQIVACADGDLCTIDRCIPASGCSYTESVDCDDSDACTIDNCDTEFGCTHTLVDCDDNNACTIDNCSSASGCNYSAVNCNDSNACTDETCDSDFGCQYTAHVCNDDVFCTSDACPTPAGCVYTPIANCCDENSDCNDLSACTNDACNAGTCAFTPVSCNDGNACTIDACNASTGCTYIAVDCNDNNACTTDGCNASTGCTYNAVNCNDNDACTTDACSAQNGCSNTAISCNDNNACTTDACSPQNGCSNTAISCNDNNACTTDACNPQSGCSNTQLVCNDNDACTTDGCNPSTGCTFPAIPNCGNCNLAINNLTLVYEGTLGEIGLLTEGQVINRQTLCRFNIRANLCNPAVGSVKFVMSGPANVTKIENVAPYAFWGDNPPGNYNVWIPNTGNYTLVVTAYSGAGASGTAGTSYTIHFTVTGSSGAACQNPPSICPGGCNDNNPCTTDACQNGQCVYTALTAAALSDNNACTDDFCTVQGGIQHTPINCADNNACTTDGCSPQTGCFYFGQPGCCTTSADCNDNDACTNDVCNSGQCIYQPNSQNTPSYLRVTNPAKSWRKLKLGYSPNSLWTPTQNVTAGGNTQMCITLRAQGTPEWNKIQIRPQGSTGSPVTLSSYISGSIPNWTTICIPLSAFNYNGFNSLSFIEIPYSNGAAAFVIDIQKIQFTGGSSPFLWFGDPHTNNMHDGQANNGSSLPTVLVAGSPCSSWKLEDQSNADRLNVNPEEYMLNAYPNPFAETLNIEFSVAADARVRVEIVNLEGKLVSEIFEGTAKGGEKQLHKFNAGTLANGMYFYRLITEDGEIHNRKLILNR